MVTKEEIIAKSKKAIMEFDYEMAEEVAEEALAEGINPAELIEEGFTVAMTEVGAKFGAGELFLPHVIAAADAMQAAIDILTPELEKMSAETKSIGTVVIGTIEGDIHTIGKDIVATMLKISGFKVIDLGRDVPIKAYVEKVKETKANVVASSALMTTTMVSQIQIEKQLAEAGVRNDVKTMVSGAPVTQEWANKIGADIYAENAADVVSKLTAMFA